MQVRLPSLLPTPLPNFSQAVCVNTVLIDIRLGESGKQAANQSTGMDRDLSRNPTVLTTSCGPLCHRWAGTDTPDAGPLSWRSPRAGRKSPCAGPKAEPRPAPEKVDLLEQAGVSGEELLEKGLEPG